ncbi:unnamed protein product, partial [marine sediment metagenome]
IHTRTASEIFGVSYDDVDATLRRKAKAVNFGIIYGMTEYGLKSRLSIPEEEAKEYIKKYFDRYPGVKKYLKFLIDDAYKKDYSRKFHYICSTSLYGGIYCKSLSQTSYSNITASQLF